VGRRSGVALPSLHGPRADVEQPGEGDLRNSKVSSDLGHFPRSELWQRPEFDLPRSECALPALVRNRVLQPGADFVEGRDLLRIRSLLHDASSFSLRTMAATALRSTGDRSAFSLLPKVVNKWVTF